VNAVPIGIALEHAMFVYYYFRFDHIVRPP
jgi:hypothetical protein